MTETALQRKRRPRLDNGLLLVSALRTCLVFDQRSAKWDATLASRDSGQAGSDTKNQNSPR